MIFIYYSLYIDVYKDDVNKIIILNNNYVKVSYFANNENE